MRSSIKSTKRQIAMDQLFYHCNDAVYIVVLHPDILTLNMIEHCIHWQVPETLKYKNIFTSSFITHHRCIIYLYIILLLAGFRSSSSSHVHRERLDIYYHHCAAESRFQRASSPPWMCLQHVRIVYPSRDLCEDFRIRHLQPENFELQVDIMY